MNIRFHFHDTNGAACCKIKDMATMEESQLYCIGGYDLAAYEITFTSKTANTTYTFEISTPMAQLDGTTYSIDCYEGYYTYYPSVTYSNGIATISVDTTTADMDFTLRINGIGGTYYMIDEPSANPEAEFITPAYAGYVLMASTTGTNYDNIQNNTHSIQTYSMSGTYVVQVSTMPVITHNITLQCDSTKGTVGYSTDGGYNWTTGTNLTVTVNAGDNLEIRAEGLTGQYDFSVWSDGNTNFWRTLTNIQADATYSATFVTHVFENTMVFTGATVTGAYFDCDNGEGYVWYPATNNTIIFDDGDFWSMKKLTTANGDIVSSVDYSYPDGTTGTNTITNPEDQIAGHYEDPGTMNITVNSTFPYAIPDLTGRRFGNVEGEESWYFTAQNAVHYQNGCGAGATSIDLNITAWVWNDSNSWPQNCWNMQTDDNIGYYYDPAEDKFYDNYIDYYPEISYDPCNPPSYTVQVRSSNINQGLITCSTDGGSTWLDPAVGGEEIPARVGTTILIKSVPFEGYRFTQWSNGTVTSTDDPYELTVTGSTTFRAYFEEIHIEKHIYLCDNSGAHLAEMTNTGSTWSVSGAFTSGMYSIRATVEGEYEDAWFKFYQTSGDNRVFVGAGDDPSFEDIGTYILVDNILTSFSLTEDQETGYYVVNYQNTGAMTASMVETIVNSYIGDFVTGSEISAMGYMTQTDISSMGYMTATDISAMSYVDSTSLSNMSYVDQTTLSSMSYVDNSYLSTYMNNVVGDINAILQTI